MKPAARLLAMFLWVARAAGGELIVDQVPPSLLAPPTGKTNTVRATQATKTNLTRQRTETPGDRWEKFEANFGIEKKDASLVKGSIQSAKYRLDETTFALQEFVDNVEAKLRFDYKLRDLGAAPPPARRSSTGSVILDTFNETRLKSDIDLKLTGRQFVGIKLVLPLGD